ncbi:hypothetical protein MRB53_007598 [Persea americana]|uniref:Uncharacterized protein n=1 Tax=Persea americana TaxID=3435 RepID=A0ACC2MJF0_PERAE|nr:hypothetical protein MRB53_007598 [Persea americana]
MASVGRMKLGSQGLEGRMKLGSQGLEVSAQGLGCMGMSAFYGPPKPEADMITLIYHAVQSGITFLDTSDIYGPFTNEALLGKALKGIRKEVELATKFGVSFADGKGEIRGDPAYVRAACEASLKRLDVDCIDLYYQHRIDTKIPIEITSGDGIVTWSALVYHLVGYVPVEERSTGDALAEEHLVGKVPSEGYLVEESLPRFQPENLKQNASIFERVAEMATRKGCTPSQLALAWVHHQGNDVCPIPGTTKIENLNQNIGALSVKLTPEEMVELESLASADAVKGERYGDRMSTWLESETPDLSSWEGI